MRYRWNCPALVRALCGVLLVGGLAGCGHTSIRVSQIRNFDWRPSVNAPVVPVPYLLYLPDGYDDPQRSNERWPLVVYLRGWPLMGMDMGAIANGGLPGEIEEGRKFPFIMVAPQTPGLWQGYEPQRVHDLIDHIEQITRVDPERVMLTGLSRGARDAWAAAAHRPERFSALVVCCGCGSASHARRCASIPVWGFHGALDFFMPVFVGEVPIAAHCAAGGGTRWTVMPTQAHWIWYEVYGRQDMYTWMLEQRRSQGGVREVAGLGPPMSATGSTSRGELAAPARPLPGTQWLADVTPSERAPSDLGALPPPVLTVLVRGAPSAP